MLNLHHLLLVIGEVVLEQIQFLVQDILELVSETPTVDISMEDFGLLYRLAENNQKPTVNLNLQSKELGKVPTYNSIARIEGVEKPDEYIIFQHILIQLEVEQGQLIMGLGL